MRTWPVIILALVTGCAEGGAVRSSTSGGPLGSGTGGPRGGTESAGAGASGGSGGRSGSAATTGGGGDTSAASSGGGETTAASSSAATTGAGGGAPGGQCMSGGPPSDPKCYWEDVCPTASLADLAQQFNGGNWLATSLEMNKRRHPSSQCLIQEYQGDVGNYVDDSSFAALAESLMTMVHEETHGYDYDHAGAGTFSYYLGCGAAAITPRIDGFPRSEILPLVQGSATSLYDGTYLTGEQGTYGFTEVLDEWNAYLNGMSGIGLVGDYVTSTISGTDGAVALAYYTELYLRVARTSHPEVHAQIAGDAATVAFLRQQWNRMHFFLALAEAYPNLSIEADAIKQNLYEAGNKAELEMVIGVPLSASSCN